MMNMNLNEGNADNMLVRKELFEIFLRMALAKYWQNRDNNNIVKCYEKLLYTIWSSIPTHFLMFKKR